MFPLRFNQTGLSAASESRPSVDPSLVIVRPERHLNLLGVARSEGRLNRPPSLSECPAEFEDLIVGEYTRRHLVGVEGARARLRALEAAARALSESLPSTRELGAVTEQASAALSRDLSDKRALVDERAAQQQAVRDLNHFKSERDIQRPAHYPASRQRHLAGVAVLAILEALVNATFFAGGSSFGFLGGLAVAVVLAAFNTITGVLVGYFCLRGLNHLHPLVRRLGGVGIALYTSLACLVNLAAGRARDVAESGVATPERFFELLRHPLDLSLLSVALVGIGLVASMLAVIKGRSLSDAIPGYRNLAERARLAERRFVEVAVELRAQVLHPVGEIPARLQALVRQGEQSLEQIERAVLDAEKAGEAYEADRQHLATACRSLLRRVRDENLRVRTTPPPRHFGEYPEFASQLDTTSLDRLRGILQESIGGVEDLKAEAHRISSGQAARVADATRRFSEFYDAQVHHADGEIGGGL